MSSTSAEEIYERHIKPLSPADRLRLLAVIARDLAQHSPNVAESPTRSILELHGLGAEIWQGVDAQEYVNELRQEWDNRP